LYFFVITTGSPSFAHTEENGDFARGSKLYDQGQLDQALLAFSKAIELNPNNAQVYYTRGFAFANTRKPELAFADFTKAVELKTDYAEANYHRGLVYKDLANQDQLKALAFGYQGPWPVLFMNAPPILWTGNSLIRSQHVPVSLSAVWTRRKRSLPRANDCATYPKCRRS
jgi:tetratricopeptide (TPR) repeat protein